MPNWPVKSDENQADHARIDHEIEEAYRHNRTIVFFSDDWRGQTLDTKRAILADLQQSLERHGRGEAREMPSKGAAKAEFLPPGPEWLAAAAAEHEAIEATIEGQAKDLFWNPAQLNNWVMGIWNIEGTWKDLAVPYKQQISGWLAIKRRKAA